MRSGDRDAMREIADELRTVRLDRPRALDELLPAIRRLLDTDNVLVYSVAEGIDGWGIERWHEAGDVSQLRRPLARAFETTIDGRLSYDPRCPASFERNRVIEAVAWVDRGEPGTWRESRLCREVFEPVGMAAWQHLRVLVCNGRELLGWFGSLIDGEATPRQARLLGALRDPMRDRLAAERALAGCGSGQAIEVILDELVVPAMIVSTGGRIREANAAARRLFERRREEVATALALACAGRPSALPIELTPLGGAAPGWLAIVREPTDASRVEQVVLAAANRWSLTPRQRAVLELVVRGASNATIACDLGVSVRAVELHVTALLDRAGVDNRTALVAAAMSLR